MEKGTTMIGRVILVILDGVGIGELPDAADFGDVGSNSIANTAKAVGGLHLPTMQKMGLGNLAAIQGVPPTRDSVGAYGKMAEKSLGKDTTIGHWELAGVYSPQPLPVFPHGFPPELVAEFEQRIGRQVIGNKPASGTEIIKELGDEHVRTGRPILYTSADSVFQLAAHEEIIPVPELYRHCETAREMLRGEFAVGRVIARPFEGEAGHYRRTERRKDWSLLPPRPTVLDKLSGAGYDVLAVGKIDDIFARRGITRSAHVVSNQATVTQTIEFLRTGFRGLLFANLIEFDMLYGHRNDPYGYARALEEFDNQLPAILNALGQNDMLIITADHGNDPVTPSTDHSREYVPLLVSGQLVRPGVDLGIRSTFADVAATIAELFSLDPPEVGTSFGRMVLQA
jgi:phosphopentomutase